MKKPLLFIFLSCILLLSACGSETQGSTEGSFFKDGIADFISTTYILQDVVSSQGQSGQISEIYSAENKSIDDVANELQEYEKPREVSEKKENKQVLIYQDTFVMLTNDEENPANTLVEVSTYDFVRNNYSPDFFDGLFLLWVLDEVLDVDDWGKKQSNKCYSNQDDCYRGYSSSGGSFKTGGTSTVRGGTSSVRGGGPGTGK
ncbi:DUF4247 domain-containing protein [Metabacillus endolithicus]|uniref:DUF4247 domain-containing protein n=1 Tax=Metabacillus endolithicus TaxID=1535204 RepID=A0ABW5BPX9_9BACI|nr:DUF4247 domain-containing protein [Metabacillus endolithicus]UPG63806.1 DUF4247 domain-containing protein [Metabacillus endolithicus]